MRIRAYGMRIAASIRRVLAYGTRVFPPRVIDERDDMAPVPYQWAIARFVACWDPSWPADNPPRDANCLIYDVTTRQVYQWSDTTGRFELHVPQLYAHPGENPEPGDGVSPQTAHPGRNRGPQSPESTA